MKIVEKYNDFILPVDLYDLNHRPIPFSEIVELEISLFTTDETNRVVYTLDDVDKEKGLIAVHAEDVQNLPNGVLYYRYKAKVDCPEEIDDGTYDFSNTLQTEIYLRNVGENKKSTCATAVSELINDAEFVTKNWILHHVVTDSSVNYILRPEFDNTITYLELTKMGVNDAYTKVEADGKFLTAASMPHKLSDLINDCGFITNDDIPTNVSAFFNDMGYLDATALEANYYTKQGVNELINAVHADIPTMVSQLTNDMGYLTQHQSLSNYYTKAEVDGLIPTVPTRVSQLINDSGFINSNALREYYNKTEVDQIINEVHGDIPAAVSQLNNDLGFITNSALQPYAIKADVDSSINEINETIAEDETATQAAFVELNGRVANLETIGRFLAIWDCSTGLPTSEPAEIPYTYKTGDYFRVGVIADGTNYMPNGLQYDGTASTTVYTGSAELSIGAVFYFDGTVWKVVASSGGGTVQDVQVNGTSVLVGGIANVEVPIKTSDLTNDSGFITSASIPTNVSAFTNDAGYLTEHQSLSNYYTKTQVDSSINAVRGEIPTVPTNVSAFTNDSHYVSSTAVTSIWKGTQAQYNAISSKSATTLYVIVG